MPVRRQQRLWHGPFHVWTPPASRPGRPIGACGETAPALGILLDGVQALLRPRQHGAGHRELQAEGGGGWLEDEQASRGPGRRGRGAAPSPALPVAAGGAHSDRAGWQLGYLIRASTPP